MSLIKEINDLRRELKVSRTHVHDLEAALGLHRKNNNTSSAATLAQISAQTKNAIMERELSEKRKVVELQQAEIYRLRGRWVRGEREGERGGEDAIHKAPSPSRCVVREVDG